MSRAKTQNPLGLAMLIINLTLLIFVNVLTSSATELRFYWNYINYAWPSFDAYSKAVQDGSYIKEHNVISGIKVWKDRLYLAIPRLTHGVPATLTSTRAEPAAGNVSPLLEPFPDWEMQKIGNCSALQFVQSMEIDPKGRMWVINNGRIQVRNSDPRSLCPTKLMIFDLENNGKLLLDYTFPEGVIHSKSVYLNDIVVDHQDGGFAYITDNDKENPGIVIFSLRERDSWKVFHESMKYDPRATEFHVNGRNLRAKSNIDGIAVSPASFEDHRLVYYSCLSSFETLTIPTSVLKFPTGKNVNDRINRLGRRPFQNDGMTMSAQGGLYFGYLVYSSIVYWNIKSPPFTRNQRILARNADWLEWPDAFAIDNKGWLWNTAKRQSRIRTDSMDLSKPNFFLVRTWIGSKSYQFYANGTAPVLPVIEEGCRMGKSEHNMDQVLKWRAFP